MSVLNPFFQILVYYYYKLFNYFLIEVFSFPLSLVCAFRGRNALKEGGFVTPRPDEVHSTCNCRDTYVHQVPL